jgi:V/A-type H+-transporting ATPase subunit E
MEIQVPELLERIQNEGIEKAKQQAEKIVSSAQNEANEIIDRAKKDAETMISESQKRIDAAQAAAHESLIQASRDTIIALRQSVQHFFELLIQADVAKAFDEKIAAQVIPEVLHALAVNQTSDFEVLLAPELAQKIDASLASRLAKELARGGVFKPYSAIDAGFRVGVVGESVQYDFSVESIAQLLSVRTNKVLAQYLNEAAERLD